MAPPPRPDAPEPGAAPEAHGASAPHGQGASPGDADAARLRGRAGAGGDQGGGASADAGGRAGGGGNGARAGAAGAAGALGRELRLIVGALGFLTRAPLPARLWAWAGHEPDRLARAARWFPLVGAAVGALCAAVWLAAGAALPAPLAAGLAVAAGVAATGALHEDGLADCCDGLGGHAGRERALEIMRDSRIGAYAGLGLIFSIGLRWAALAALEPAAGAAALIVAHAWARALMTGALAASDYARPTGAAAGAAGVTRAEAGAALGLALAIAAALGGAGAVAACGAGLVAGLWMLRLLKRRLGGHTGDGLGAIEQLGEIAVMTTLAGLWT
ncbi:adenosylcobinamide-GDP ribazoletransferase [Oceanicella actignis]|uniref:adenosylcobinamide-GDP ribazoletransferase n=1 Tax=Oceanicella actignis TaxID=1189325 RepID=UPI0011E7BD1A|nr:adenosylcobinamide-GDP ribazoletransferase [Oceanicella actignis]TYO88446.1 cobalamin-5'-phosphate synthase [Oceanicella actignis]